MKSLLIGAPIFAPALEEIRRRADLKIEVFEDGGKACPNAHFYFGDKLPAGLLDGGNLEFIQLGSVGFSQLYGMRLPERGVRVCNARGVFDPTIAEWNLAMMINLMRDVPRMLTNQQRAVWDRDAQ